MSTEPNEKINDGIEEQESPAGAWRRDLGFDEQAVFGSGKRCGVQWTPWMGDFFTSWSPRNSNNNAEGPWDHWVDLAIMILRDPMTKLVRPGAHQVAAEANLEPAGFYSETNRSLTDDELMERFHRADSISPEATP